MLNLSDAAVIALGIFLGEMTYFAFMVMIANESSDDMDE
jgi:hypothetical protein